MRLTVLCQYARGVAHHDAAAGQSLLAELERIKWLLWHGNQYRAGETISFFLDDVDALEVDYPNLSKFARAAQEFSVYIASNTGGLINYGERFRAGERISSCLAESTVNAVISKRFAKRQQMQWTKRGAHLLLQTRTQRSMARSGLSSRNGIPASPTTTQPGPLRTRPHETPDILMLSSLGHQETTAIATTTKMVCQKRGSPDTHPQTARSHCRRPFTPDSPPGWADPARP